MSLYVLNKRDAAREHLYNKEGGIRRDKTLTYDKEKSTGMYSKRMKNLSP